MAGQTALFRESRGRLVRRDHGVEGASYRMPWGNFEPGRETRMQAGDGRRVGVTRRILALKAMMTFCHSM